MAYRREQFKPEHAYELADQVMQGPEKTGSFRDLGRLTWETVVDLGIAVSGFRDDVLIGSGGVLCPCPDHARAWAMFSVDITLDDMLWVRGEGLNFLNTLQVRPEYKRIEVILRLSSEREIVWAEMFGFTPQHDMLVRDDSMIYARIAK